MTRILAVVAAIGLMLLTGGTTQAGSGPVPRLSDHAPRWSPTGEWISFLRETASPYLVRPDRTGLKQAPLLDDYAWSPDGRSIATSYQLTLYYADTGSRVVLRPSRFRTNHPTWAPDGLRIAFTAGLEKKDVFVVAADGSGEKNLTRSPKLDEFRASWSPRGDLIAFQSGAGLDVMAPDGSGKRRISRRVPGRGINWGFSWSPDGSRIAFVRAAEARRTELLVLDVATSATRTLERGNVVPAEPAWSPDGKQIAYSVGGYPDGRSSIRVATADGNGVQTLREGAFPSWSADGRRLAFISLDGCAPSRWGVFVATAEGADPHRVTNDCWLYGTPAA